MPAVKDKKTGKWEVFLRYTDYQGNNIKKHKRGFSTKKEALEWEREFLNKIEFNISMTFKSLSELYLEDLKHRLKENTLETKKFILKHKILPFFEKLTLEKITPITIREWQNKLLKTINPKTNEKYTQTYIKTINNQLVAIFNYAVKYHNLKENPCHKAGSIGKKNAEEMQIWSVEEFEKFLIPLSHKPVQYTGFNILFWTGVRIGELLALTINDIDLENKKININKSYQRIKGRDVITPPKTPKSKRIIDISDDLADIIKEYLSKLYEPTKNTRLFECTKFRFEHDIKNYSLKAGVKKIRVHDLRHSHASFLFNKGIDPLTISLRLGHEKIETTLNIYTHLYKEKNTNLINILNNGHGGKMVAKN